MTAFLTVQLSPTWCQALFFLLCTVFSLALYRAVPASTKDRFSLFVVLCVTMILRFIWVYDYPPGLYDDEVLHLVDGWRGYTGEVAAFDTISRGAGVPVLPFAIINGSIWDLGANAWWAIRGWPLVLGSLGVVFVYDIVRLMGGDNRQALLAGWIYATFPIILAYCRYSMGGEIFFYSLTVLWAILREKGKVEYLTVVAGLALLAYGYFAGRSMVPVSVCCILTWRKSWKAKWIGISAVGLALLIYLPTLYFPTERSGWGFWPGSNMTPSEEWLDRLKAVGMAIWSKESGGRIGGQPMSLSSLIKAPELVVIFAAIGWLCTGWRNKMVLAVLLLGGIAPTIVGAGGISAHRMLVGMLALPIAAGLGLEALISYTGKIVVAFCIAMQLGATLPKVPSDEPWHRSECNFACKWDGMKGGPVMWKDVELKGER